MAPLSNQLRGTLLMVLAVFVLSPDALLISLISADTWLVIFWRGLITVMTLTTVLVVRYRLKTFDALTRVGIPGVAAGVFFAISTISFVFSVRLTTAANTLVIIAAMPLFAAVLSKVFLRDAVEKRTWMAVIAGLVGIVLVFKGSLKVGHPLGDLLALVTALLMASNFVIIRKHQHVDMIPAVLLSGMITTVFTAFLCQPLSVGRSDFLLLAVMGTVVLPVPLALMTIGPKLIPAAEVSLIMLLETFLGPFWVWLALGERPANETFLGGGILVATLVVHALAGKNRIRAGVPG